MYYYLKKILIFLFINILKALFYFEESCKNAQDLFIEGFFLLAFIYQYYQRNIEVNIYIGNIILLNLNILKKIIGTISFYLQILIENYINIQNEQKVNNFLEILNYIFFRKILY